MFQEEQSPLLGPAAVRFRKKRLCQFKCILFSTIFIILALIILTMIFYSNEAVIPADSIMHANNSNNGSTTNNFLQSSYKENNGTNINEDIDQVIDSALNFGRFELKRKTEQDDLNTGLTINSPSYLHQKAIMMANQSIILASKGYIIDRASQHFFRKYGSNVNWPTIWNRQMGHELVPMEMCSSMLNCKMNKYRSIDGTCNNLRHSTSWGVAFRPFRRVLKADYSDGISLPRISSTGQDLPSSRKVSLNMHRPDYKIDKDFTIMLASWGQFIDHDITATALSKGTNGKLLSCCHENSINVHHPDCYAVKIDTDDPYFGKFNQTCMDFVRSAASPQCSLGPREQLNQVSSYLDGSAIYGNIQILADNLRSFNNGQLLVSISPDGRSLLPISKDPNDGCNKPEENAKGRYCFLSGDSRANENIYLTSLHLILVRQHNRVCASLRQVNPDWDDEIIYQEARRIIVAQLQHITYNEFLPIILGENVMVNYNIKVSNENKQNYNETIDSTISNNFATVAFRFAHTLIPRMVSIKKNSNLTELIELHRMLFNPYNLYSPGYLDGALLGAIQGKVEVDKYVNKEITERLFEKPKHCGLDLVTLNIQRGRDHGIPSYPHWRSYCNLTVPKTWEDLKTIMDDDSIDQLSALYKSVKDIDLYTAMISEIPKNKSILGPIGVCLIADQFYRLKFGDRYWYETNQYPQAFTEGQLLEIKKITLAKIICDNSDSVEFAQSQVMQSVSERNKLIKCTDYPNINYNLWKNNGKYRYFEKATNDDLNFDKNDPNIIVQKDFASIKLTEGSIIFNDPLENNLNSLNFPITINTDLLSNPNSFNSNINIEFIPFVNNDTISGQFIVPYFISNNTKIISETLEGTFKFTFETNYDSNLNQIENGINYKCKLMFISNVKLSLNATTPKLIGETCAIQLKGVFYEPSFFCFFTPWWCSNEKLFYWNGNVDVVLRKAFKL